MPHDRNAHRRDKLAELGIKLVELELTHDQLFSIQIIGRSPEKDSNSLHIDVSYVNGEVSVTPHGPGFCGPDGCHSVFSVFDKKRSVDELKAAEQLDAAQRDMVSDLPLEEFLQFMASRGAVVLKLDEDGITQIRDENYYQTPPKKDQH